MSEEKKSKEKGMKDKSFFKFERGSVKYCIIEFISLVVAAMIIWPLFDLILCAIRHNEFKYTFGDYVIGPLVFATIFLLIDYVVFKCQKKK